MSSPFPLAILKLAGNRLAGLLFFFVLAVSIFHLGPGIAEYIHVTYALSLGVGESKGGEGGKRKGGVSLPVLHRDTKGQAEERHAVGQGELRVVLSRMPVGGRGGGGGKDRVTSI